MNNLVLTSLEEGGYIAPLLIPSELSGGLGLMNPSIYNDGGKLIVNLRNVNYTFYHSEKKLFQHPYGPLTYIHPENDIHLRTWNWYLELNNDTLAVEKFIKVDTSLFDTYEPKWDFVGLEDARIFRWNNTMYLSGVRRDTTENGEGRMELSEIVVGNDKVKEISRVRIQPPNDPTSYCEKNWMPILDRPFEYIKWSNPTEVVKVDNVTGLSKTTHLGNLVNLPRDLRGGSQLIPFEDGYLAITHEVDLFDSEAGRKDAVYWHRLIKWDKNFNIVRYSKEFHFMDGCVEFCIGLAEEKNNFLITFGFQDNAAFVLRAPKTTISKFLYENN